MHFFGKNFFFCLLVSLTAGNNLHGKHAISYGFSEEKTFGDTILGYAQARYLSYMTSLPFLYHPFDFSEQLHIGYDALPYATHASQYSRQFHIKTGETLTEFLSQIRNPDTPSTLFIVDYFPLDFSFWVFDKITENLILNTPWHDAGFATILKNALRPKLPIPDFTKRNHLNVAVHVIASCDGRDVQSSTALPKKYQNCDYLKHQIEKVYAWNLKRPMYVFLFSNTSTPLDLLKEFRQHFKNYTIEFDIQTLKDPDCNTTVQDFFAMQTFDVLIATQSNYSMMASLMGTFDMVMFPIRVHGNYPNYRINQVQVISKKSAWFPYEFNVILKN